ncbi:MAG: type II toxin-antitoxin system PemK/MazF family toxin [Verrucomicrobia bacterium]|nr:type II toxin-antitoxin system PemK/MazF family toxin [Verrucomicrobiota bacterium]
MRPVPQPGEVWSVDLGRVGKPRYALVLAARTDARLALASVVLITTQFEDTPYEVALPRVPWLREQSYINVQSIQPVKFTEFVRKAPGELAARVVSEVEAVLKYWLKL